MEKPFIIAELGINHSGSFEIAKKMIDMAIECGCNTVKFQKRTVETVYSKEFLDQPRKSPWGTTQRDQKMGLELSGFAYNQIDEYCKDKIEWFASAWDCKSQEFLQKYDLPYNKIASAMLTNRELVEMVAWQRKFTFISTGMSNFEQIDRVVELVDKANTPFCLMHCVSVYPCPDEWCNLMMIKSLQTRYGHMVGYSGHEMGILPSVLAVSLGAEVIERHITLSRSMYGSDQSASLEKHGLEILVRDCRDVYKMLGSGVKEIIPKEEETAYKLRYFKEWE
ncbi:MAG: N-acetylneuraminate synthase family protein [Nitrospirota bacterium]